jgi:hypothetical protein
MRNSRGLTLAAIGLLLSLIGGCSRSGPGNVPPLLAAAGFAPLPPSATNVTYYEWAGMGTGNAYARFEANPADLNLFILNSPALQGKKPERSFDATHQHLSIAQKSWSPSLPTDNEYYLEGPSDPKWFHPTVLGKGRRYLIDFNRSSWVLFDEEKNIVWLFTSRG